MANNGFIVGISSVAGDRGRQSNYIYGSANLGLSIYLNGLRNRMQNYNIHVLTVKPGYVNTKMTAHLNLPAVLTCRLIIYVKKIISGQKKVKILYM